MAGVSVKNGSGLQKPGRDVGFRVPGSILVRKDVFGAPWGVPVPGRTADRGKGSA